jgi:hypothetical protein
LFLVCLPMNLWRSRLVHRLYHRSVNPEGTPQERDDAKYNVILHKANCTAYNFSCRAKLDDYNVRLNYLSGGLYSDQLICTCRGKLEHATALPRSIPWTTKRRRWLYVICSILLGPNEAQREQDHSSFHSIVM